MFDTIETLTAFSTPFMVIGFLAIPLWLISFLSRFIFDIPSKKTSRVLLLVGITGIVVGGILMNRGINILYQIEERSEILIGEYIDYLDENSGQYIFSPPSPNVSWYQGSDSYWYTDKENRKPSRMPSYDRELKKWVEGGWSETMKEYFMKEINSNMIELTTVNELVSQEYFSYQERIDSIFKKAIPGANKAVSDPYLNHFICSHVKKDVIEKTLRGNSYGEFEEVIEIHKPEPSNNPISFVYFRQDETNNLRQLQTYRRLGNKFYKNENWYSGSGEPFKKGDGYLTATATDSNGSMSTKTAYRKPRFSFDGSILNFEESSYSVKTGCWNSFSCPNATIGKSQKFIMDCKKINDEAMFMNEMKRILERQK